GFSPATRPLLRQIKQMHRPGAAEGQRATVRRERQRASVAARGNQYARRRGVMSGENVGTVKPALSFRLVRLTRSHTMVASVGDFSTGRSTMPFLIKCPACGSAV